MKKNTKEGIKAGVKRGGLLLLMLTFMYILFAGVIPYILEEGLEYDEYCEYKGFDKHHNSHYAGNFFICESQGRYETFEYTDYSIWFAKRH